MPLLAPVTTSEPTPTPPEPLPPSTPPPSPYVTWTPAGGGERILSGNGKRGIHLGGVGDPGSIIGLDMPPQEEFDTELAGGGELANGRRWGARSIALPIVIHADGLDGEQGLETYRRALLADFNPARGEGVLTIAYPNGGRRHLRASYSSGLDTPEQGRMGGPRYYDSYVVILKARDPFAYGDEETISFSIGAGGPFFPLPFTISPSTTTGESTVEIDGEVEVFPVWTLRGPMTTATLENRDTGKSLELSPSLSAGQTLVVRTDPRTPPAKQFTRASSNVWGSVAGDFPVFWSLQPGSNRVTVLANGTGSDSRVTLSYAPRYLSA